MRDLVSVIISLTFRTFFLSLFLFFFFFLTIAAPVFPLKRKRRPAGKYKPKKNGKEKERRWGPRKKKKDLLLLLLLLTPMWISSRCYSEMNGERWPSWAELSWDTNQGSSTRSACRKEEVKMTTRNSFFLSSRKREKNGCMNTLLCCLQQEATHIVLLSFYTWKSRAYNPVLHWFSVYIPPFSFLSLFSGLTHFFPRAWARQPKRSRREKKTEKLKTHK